ncbi:MAG: acyl-CoA thioesterase [Alphaproteobacteria bacterium]
MYPVFRMVYQILKHRNDPALPLGGAHISEHICWPWDLDLWMELNNGRTLTLYDLGRIPLARRIGLLAALKRRKWGLTVAGSSVRYRRRVTMFNRFEMRSRTLGRDARFFYIQQSMWRNGEATSSALYRTAVTDKNGIVATDLVVQEMGHPDWNPTLPEWVQTWIDAEAQRVWPPEV